MIIPRWEWRTFNDDFGPAEAAIKSHERTGHKISQEKYIISKVSDENIKIRDDLIDIKSLQEINGDKLEQWNPAMKEGFPTGKDKIEILFNQFFKVAPPALTQDSYTYQEFLALVADCPQLVIVDVEKERHIYTIEEATVEIAETKFNGVPMRTACVEHIDPALVISLVKKLGLVDFKNINYINAMKMAVGL